MPAQYALTYYLGSAILGSVLSIIGFLPSIFRMARFTLTAGMVILNQLWNRDDWFITFSWVVELGVV